MAKLILEALDNDEVVGDASICTHSIKTQKNDTDVFARNIMPHYTRVMLTKLNVGKALKC